jgi:hypothetical protein
MALASYRINSFLAMKWEAAKPNVNADRNARSSFIKLQFLRPAATDDVAVC